MERSINFDLEKRQREENIAILEATDGFASLSDKQRRIIKLSFYIQERANRLEIFDMRYVGAVGPYKQCRHYVINSNCHSSVAGVEAESVLAADPDNIPPVFFEAKYYDSKKYKNIEKKIEDFGFPCVVITSLECGNETGEDTKEHSFLALGRYKNNIVVWDKKGYDYPYRVTTLKAEYSEYGQGHFWGLRELRT